MYNIFKLLINNLSKYKNTLKSVFLKHIKLFITIPFYTLFNFFILLLYTKQIINKLIFIIHIEMLSQKSNVCIIIIKSPAGKNLQGNSLFLFSVSLNYLYKKNQLFVSVFPTLLFFYRTINNYLLYFNS